MVQQSIEFRAKVARKERAKLEKKKNVERKSLNKTELLFVILHY